MPDLPDPAATGPRGLDAPHVFVVHGDLARMACDDVLVPTDLSCEVAESWLPLLPPRLVGPPGRAGRRVLLEPGPEWQQGRQRVLPLADHAPASDRRAWLVETVARRLEPDRLLTGVEQFFDALAEVEVPAPLHGRARRLVGVPLVGTGGGGAAGQRGAVIRDLLPLLARRAAQHDVDVALVLLSASDHAAAQQVRRGLDMGWPLPEPLQTAAADLAARATAGDLALFLGSGVSAAAGLPVWGELLAELAEVAGVPEGEREALQRLPAMDAGLLLARRLGADALGEWVGTRFGERPYALAHGLLAGLPVRQLVTTNYDRLYESAAAAVGRAPAVLPWDESVPDRPWLLKLHGDAGRPGSVVLTREHYLRFGEDRAALAGVVQALLLTRHVLFVGFSLVDDNLIRIAHQVRQVQVAEGAGAEGGQAEPRRGGTALAVVDEPVRAQLWEDDLHYLPMTPAGTPLPVAGRRLEVFLDLVGSLASAPLGYLLDRAYEGMLSPGEQALATALQALPGGLPDSACGTPAWQAVHDLLVRLGLQDADDRR